MNRNLRSLIEVDQATLPTAWDATRRLRVLIFTLTTKRPTLDILERMLEDVQSLEQALTVITEWLAILHQVLPEEAAK